MDTASPGGPAPEREGTLRGQLAVLRCDLTVGNQGADSDSDAPLRGRLGSDHENGADTLIELGGLLLPGPLRDRLLRATRERPVRLLHSLGPSLAWVPVGLLPLDGAAPPTVVLERAVPQLMAPELPAVVGHLDCPSSHGTLAVLDPTDEFSHLEGLARMATRLLGGAALTDPAPAEPANRATLLGNLAAADRYHSFLLVAHHRAPSAERPLAGGIEVGIGSEHTVITAAELLAAAPRLRAPEVVLLCACSTAASALDPRTERWGLPTALLLAGARTVVATCWDLRWCAATAAFVEDLLGSLSTGDAATVLRRVQMDRLDRWRAAARSSRGTASNNSSMNARRRVDGERRGEQADHGDEPASHPPFGAGGERRPDRHGGHSR